VAPPSNRVLDIAGVRRALVVTGVSLAVLLLWNHVRVFTHPWGDLSNGNYTDHLSHMNAARAFTRVGLDIWRKPAIALTRPPTPEEEVAFPADVHPGGKWTGGVYMIDGWPATKPWVTSWGQQPRLYPPGDMLLVAPVALVYHHTSLSLTEANRWLYSFFLVYAHAAIFFIVWGAAVEKRLALPLLDLCALFVTVQIVFWTLQGFYDAAAVGPLLVCARYLDARRGLAAAVAYSVAAFIHFRAFFLAPWVMYAAWIFAQDRQWRGLRPRDWGAVAVGAVCSFGSLFAFALVVPTLGGQKLNNVMHWSHAADDPRGLAVLAAVSIVAAVLLARVRAWLDLAVLAWLTLIILVVNEAHEWHIVIPLAWLVAPVSVVIPGKTETVRAARLLFMGHVAVRVWFG
jgi:hypothetical protein